MYPPSLPTPPREKTKRVLLVATGIAVLLLATAALLISRYWLFTEKSVRSRLAASIPAEIHFASFQEKYFPPGCVAENVVFQRAGGGQKLIVIRRLTVQSGLFGLFRHHVSLLRAEGMRVELARSDLSSLRSSGQRTTIDRLIADDAVLEVVQGDKQPLRFVFQKFRLQNVGGSGTTKFSATFQNPLPEGILRTSGEFGPWNHTDTAATPISGKYSLENANLGVFGGIAGTMSSTGNLQGTLKQVQVKGSTNSPAFEVTSTQHKQPLETQFDASVNAITGETVLRHVKAKFGRDEIEAQGSIGRQSDGKRAAVIDLSCDRGRIEDTFYPFISSPKSPVAGNVQFRMHVVIPSGHEQFLEKVNLRGDFQVLDAELTNPQTELRLTRVAEAPHQKRPLNTGAQISGHVELNGGVAHLSSLLMRDGDASAQLHGTYNLQNERVNMHGELETEASLTKTTSGIKAAFAKAIEPFLRKWHHEKVVPVRISGTYRHPSFGLDMQSSM
jgi:hypothetical protein